MFDSGRVQLTADSSPVPLKVRRMTEEAQGVQQHTPQPVRGQHLHTASVAFLPWFSVRWEAGG